MGNKVVTTKQDKLFFAEIAAILHKARETAYKAVNTLMVGTYWNIGKRIVEQEQQGNERANYGDQLLVNLSRYLSSTFGKGFSVANLWNFRQFYLTWPNEKILYTLCRELSWSHIRLIGRRGAYPASIINFLSNEDTRRLAAGFFIMRLDSEKDRKYYLNETRAQGWSVRVLERNIRTGYFKRMLSSHFYIDLVLYNYLLKCFVIIDLKTKKLTHQDIGQMDMYVRMFDDLKRGEGDYPHSLGYGLQK